jgi:predicted DNA-binding protein (MmcQ/YjbR family)
MAKEKPIEDFCAGTGGGSRRSLREVQGQGAMARFGTAFDHVRRFALAFPETREDHPWGESAIKVRGKTFVFLGGDESKLHLSVKLPTSREFALEYPFTEPTRYGLGKSGWVTAVLPLNAKVPLDILEAWIAESYQAIAPKSLRTRAAAQAELGAAGPGQKSSRRRKPKRQPEYRACCNELLRREVPLCFRFSLPLQ